MKVNHKDAVKVTEGHHPSFGMGDEGHIKIKEGTQMGNKHLKSCPTPSAIRK